MDDIKSTLKTKISSMWGKKIVLNIIPSNITIAILDPPHEFNTTTKLSITE
jgi:hypothetical protein